MGPSGLYRAASGLVFRVRESLEGSLSVQVLRDGVWVAGSLGMIGLRLRGSTVRLPDDAVPEADPTTGREDRPSVPGA